MNKFSVATAVFLNLASLAAVAAPESDDLVRGPDPDQYFWQQLQITDGATRAPDVRRHDDGASESCPYDRSTDARFREFWAQLQLTDGVTSPARTQPLPTRYAASPAAGNEKMAMMDCGEMMKKGM